MPVMGYECRIYTVDSIYSGTYFRTGSWIHTNIMVPVYDVYLLFLLSALTDIIIIILCIQIGRNQKLINFFNNPS